MLKKGFSKERDEKFKRNHSILFTEPDEQELAFNAEQEVMREARIAARKSQKLAATDADKLRAKVEKSLQKLQEFGYIVDAEHISKSTLDTFEKAVRKGKSKIVENILKKFRYLPLLQAQLLAANNKGLNPLNIAAANNHGGVVRKILKAVKHDRAQLEKLLAPTAIGTPWQIAVKGNCNAVTEVFLDFAETNKEFSTLLFQSRTPRGFLDDPANPLELLVIKGRDGFVKRILGLGKDNRELGALLFSLNGAGSTALHTAATWERSGMVKALVDFGFTPNVRNSDGKTALDLTKANVQRMEPEVKKAESKLEEKKKELAQIEERMANIGPIRTILANAKYVASSTNSNALPDDAKLDKVVEQLLKLISANENSRYTEILKGKNGRYAAPFVAVDIGNSELVRAAVDAGMDPNGKDRTQQYNMLHCAIACLHPKVVTTLLELGADPQAKSRNPVATPLELLKMVEDRWIESKGCLEKEIKESSEQVQRLLNARELVTTLEKAMASTAIPIPVERSQVVVSQVVEGQTYLLGRHTAALFSLAHC